MKKKLETLLNCLQYFFLFRSVRVFTEKQICNPKLLIFTISEIDNFFSMQIGLPLCGLISFHLTQLQSVLITLCEKESQISKMLLVGKLFRLVTIRNLYLKGQFEVKLTTTKGLEDQKLKRLAYFSENAVRD